MNFDSETSNPLNISPDSKLYLETASGYTLVEDLIITGDAIDGAKAIININKYTFSGCSSIKTVTIGKASSGSGVQVICNNAFIECKNLKSVVIKNSVTYIQDMAMVLNYLIILMIMLIFKTWLFLGEAQKALLRKSHI